MEKGKRVKLIVNVNFVLRAVGDGTPDWGTESDSSERSEGSDDEPLRFPCLGTRGLKIYLFPPCTSFCRNELSRAAENWSGKKSGAASG